MATMAKLSAKALWSFLVSVKGMMPIVDVRRRFVRVGVSAVMTGHGETAARMRRRRAGQGGRSARADTGAPTNTLALAARPQNATSRSECYACTMHFSEIDLASL